MAWIDSTYVDNAIGSTVRAAIDGGSSTVFTQIETQARVRIKEIAATRGYELGDTTTSDQLKDLCCGVWIVIGLGMRKGIRYQVPAQYQDIGERLNALKSGDLRLLDYTPSSRDGIGGASFSATTGTNGRPQQMSRKALTQW